MNSRSKASCKGFLAPVLPASPSPVRTRSSLIPELLASLADGETPVELPLRSVGCKSACCGVRSDCHAWARSSVAHVARPFGGSDGRTEAFFEESAPYTSHSRDAGTVCRCNFALSPTVSVELEHLSTSSCKCVDSLKPLNLPGAFALRAGQPNRLASGALLSVHYTRRFRTARYVGRPQAGEGLVHTCSRRRSRSHNALSPESSGCYEGRIERC